MNSKAAETGNGEGAQGVFSMRIVVSLVAVGVLSFAAFIVLSAFADDLRKPEDGGTHALSKSAVGFAAIVSLLEGEGRAIRMSRGELGETAGEPEISVLTPSIGQAVTAEDIAGAWNGVLVVLPKWDAWPDREHPGWVRSNGLAQSQSIERVLRQLDNGFTVGQSPGTREMTLKAKDSAGADIPAGEIERLQTMVSVRIEPILTDGAGHAVLGRLLPPTLNPDEALPGAEDAVEAPPYDDWADPETPYPYGREIFVLSEPDLLNTKGLASAATAKAGLQMIDLIAPGKQPVVFDLTLHGMERSRNFMKLLLEPPFLPAVVCLAFAASLMAVNAVAGQIRVRSGREIALGKTMLVENSALLVSLLGRDVHMGKRYVAMTCALAATAAGVPPRSSEKQQTDMLDAANRGEGEARFSQLASEVAKAETPSALTNAANKLFRWRQEIGREYRRR